MKPQHQKRQRNRLQQTTIDADMDNRCLSIKPSPVNLLLSPGDPADVGFETYLKRAQAHLFPEMQRTISALPARVGQNYFFYTATASAAVPAAGISTLLCLKSQLPLQLPQQLLGRTCVAYTSWGKGKHWNSNLSDTLMADAWFKFTAADIWVMNIKASEENYKYIINSVDHCSNYVNTVLVAGKDANTIMDTFQNF
ncbi:hypothetical protein BDK51DRAFT_29645 [Blyttiomyces helicus]|uniref:Uncharacterized protein n=1 Tax=Blyttiomyces helicus TaxID=388810 RepID=A0A4P9WND3_9FUNG|nr:hypothetical protein BDK51DRAFT_29645 [Blyttiomyces helicus]|eukprot:RKO94454.1 hypothetical protein BDK51DRAFT_29645 [Blyttiomyces helicus]